MTKPKVDDPEQYARFLEEASKHDPVSEEVLDRVLLNLARIKPNPRPKRERQ